MTTNTRLIVLAFTKFKDSAIVLHTLSRAYGRRSFLVSVGRSGAMARYLPLNILEADIQENTRSTLWRATNLSPVHPLVSIRNSPFKNTMTLFLSEVLYRTLHEGTCEEALFDWCERSILTLEALEQDYANFHLRFLLELSTALGFAPTLEDLMPFSGERTADLDALLHASFTEAMLLPLSGVRRNEIADILLQYIGYHAETSLNIQSL